jgi:hypothetical protein
MNEAKAREILKGMIFGDGSDGSLAYFDPYVSWTPGNSWAVLDGNFELDELEAIAWWIRNAKRGETSCIV